MISQRCQIVQVRWSRLYGFVRSANKIRFVNKLLKPFAGAALGKILVLVFIILFIQKRPRRLFALRGRFVET